MLGRELPETFELTLHLKRIRTGLPHITGHRKSEIIRMMMLKCDANWKSTEALLEVIRSKSGHAALAIYFKDRPGMVWPVKHSVRYV